MDKNFIARIETLVERMGGQSALARRSGLSLGAVQRYLKGGDPGRTALIKLCEACGVTLDWLVYGATAPSNPPDTKGFGAGEQAVPLHGFGESSQQGWYQEIDYKITAALSWPDPACFAVAAADDGLAPEGLRRGHICIVSPHTRPHPGDIVFIRRTDGTASLRAFAGEDQDWIHIRGYMGGDHMPYQEQTRRTALTLIAPVVFVKRRA